MSTVVGEQPQRVVRDGHMPVRRHHEDDARVQGRVVRHEPHGQPAVPGQNVGQDTGLRGGQVLRDDHRRREVRRHGCDQRGERRDATC